MKSNEKSRRDERDKRICNLREEGYSTTELSAEFHLSLSSINKILHKHGLTAVNMEKKLMRDRQILDLRKQGYAEAYIRNRLNVSKHVVTSVIREYEIDNGAASSYIIKNNAPVVKLGQVLCNYSADNLLHNNEPEYWKVMGVYPHCVLLHKVINGECNHNIRWCPGFTEIWTMLRDDHDIN